MCLAPISIYNPKFRFSQVGGHRMKLDVPCGKCAECQKRNADQYVLRTYYEALDCFRAGGFVLNDTLTYDDKHVPHVSDFVELSDKSFDYMCFSPQDFRLFMVRLRKRLSDLGYNPVNNLKYFMSSEYGTSVNCSHRPHYHVLFFVRDCGIAPLVFSNIIADCWDCGRTDGVPYKSNTYVLSKRIFSSQSNNDLIHLSNVCTYVAKYISKDSWFEKVITQRLESLLVSKYGLSWRDNEDAKDFYSSLCRICCQFHRNSQHFGECALLYNDIEDVKFSGFIRMPDRHNVVRLIPLPMYFKRKLFYELTKDFRGKPVWKLTKDGVQHQLNQFERRVEDTVRKFDSWRVSLPNMCDNHEYICNRFVDLLHGRSVRDFVIYLLAYRGRVLPANYVDAISNGDNLYMHDVPSVDMMLACEHEDGVYGYFYQPRNSHVKYKVSFTYYGDKDNPVVVHGSPCFTDIDVYCKHCVISESTFDVFRDFDKLFDLYVSSLYHYNLRKQNFFYYKQHLKDVCKCLQTNFSPIKNF